MRSVLVSIVLLLMSGFLSAQPAEKKSAPVAAPAKPVAALAWLVGGVWTADASKMGSGLQRIETRYEWSDNGAYLHFTTHFVSDNGTLKAYAGSLYWDPEKKALAIWYMDAEGEITQGPMEWADDLLRVTFRGPDFSGKVADLKVDVTRKNNDHYHWAVSEKSGNSWQELGALEYLRQSADSTQKPS